MKLTFVAYMMVLLDCVLLDTTISNARFIGPPPCYWVLFNVGITSNRGCYKICSLCFCFSLPAYCILSLNPNAHIHIDTTSHTCIETHIKTTYTHTRTHIQLQCRHKVNSLYRKTPSSETLLHVSLHNSFHHVI